MGLETCSYIELHGQQKLMFVFTKNFKLENTKLILTQERLRGWEERGEGEGATDIGSPQKF